MLTGALLTATLMPTAALGQTDGIVPDRKPATGSTSASAPTQASTAPEAARAPSEVMAAFHAALDSAARGGDSLGYQGRYDLLKPVVEATFDLPTMTRVAVGTRWADLAGAEQDALVEAFTAFTVANWASRFATPGDRRFEITGERDIQPPGRMVETVLIDGTTRVAINYVLREAGGRWRVADVFLAGTISELATRRSEFASILAQQGAAGLVTALEDRVRRMAAS